MTAHVAAVTWCVVQAALLAALGLVAARMFMRKAPASGAMAAASAVAIILLSTALAPVKLPGIEMLSLVDSVESVATTESGDGSGASRASAIADGRGVDLSRLVTGAMSAIRGVAVAKPQADGVVGSWAAAVFACGAILGTARLFAAVGHVRRLRRESRAVSDRAVLRQFAQVKTRLGIFRDVEFCESASVDSPTVVGWRRPMVVLPMERSEWSDEQLRAALAHELAHVARGDYFWRCVMGLTQAIHYFHPLVHLLARRLTLLQEMATDDSAAAAVGGREAYLRALSELALRLDDTSRLRAEPIVLPALSSNLVRRIAMLRSKEGSVAERNHSWAGAAAVGLIALAGVVGVALRGHADAVEPMPAAARSSELFSRSPLTASMLTTSEGGLFVIRPSEIAKQPQFQPVFRLLNKMFLESLRQLEGVNVAADPEIRFEEIEYIAGVPKVDMRAKTQTDEEDGRLMIGCTEWVVRFHDQIVWDEWFEEVLPGSAHTAEDGFTYYELPEIPAVGTGLGVAVRDARTLVFATGRDRLRELAAAEAVPPVSPSAWKSLDGGLATVLALGELSESVLPEDPAARMAVTIMLKTVEYGTAFDVDPATSQSNVRVMLTSRNQADGEALQAAVESILPLVIAQLEMQIESTSHVTETPGAAVKQVQTEGDANTEREVRTYWLRLLGSLKTRLEPQADGTVWVRVEGGAVLPPTIMTAYEYVATEEAQGRRL